jgi:hypothetical protein
MSGALKSATREHERDARFDPAAHLLGILKQLIADNQSARISLDGSGEIQVIPEEGIYASTLKGETLRRFCSAETKGYAIKRLAPGVPVDRERPVRNLDELLWNASLSVSGGRLLKGCEPDDVVLLKHWPNFTRIETTTNSIRIARPC